MNYTQKIIKVKTNAKPERVSVSIVADDSWASSAFQAAASRCMMRFVGGSVDGGVLHVLGNPKMNLNYTLKEKEKVKTNAKHERVSG